MKNDARFILNKKKFKNQSGNRPAEIQRGGSRASVDARKILNIKRAERIMPNKQVVRGSRNQFHQSAKGSNKFNQSGKGIFTKAFSAVSKAPDKRIKLTNDGNILVTAKSKDTQRPAQPSQRVSSFGGNMLSTTPSQVQKPFHQWVPADVEMDNLEHIGINDLIDMESLPPAIVSSNIPPQNRMLPRMLPDGIAGMQNTMIADQIASTSSSQARVFVMNLHPSVTKQDIMELFGDVGIVKGIQMTQPGEAVIEFFISEDAIKACSTYHNRLLDGHPMKCYLESNVTQQRTSVSQRLGGRIESASPIASSSSSFVPNPRSRYNPRDVRFTVKLT